MDRSDDGISKRVWWRYGSWKGGHDGSSRRTEGAPACLADGLIWVVIFSACVGGDAHWAYTAPREVHMAIEHGKMTAALDQVPLQAVLDQL